MENSLQYASLDRRFLAAFIDLMILVIPCAVASHIIPVAGSFAVLFFYAPVLECSPLSATLGKYWMGIQVVDPQGRRISLTAATVRNLVKLFSTPLLFLGWIVALFTSKKQALHDLLADTVVVFGRSQETPASAWETSVRTMVGSATPAARQSSITLLERLQALREKGTITEEEFQAQKKKILEDSGPGSAN